MKTTWVATLNASDIKWLEKLTKIGIVLITALLVQYCSESEDMIVVEEPHIPSPRESIVVHTDLDPDFRSETINDYYKIDLDNDGAADFTLRSQSYSYSEEGENFYFEYLEFTSQTSNSGNGIISVTPWLAYPLPLEQGMEIYNLRTYRNGESYSNSGIFTIGDCAGPSFCTQDWKEKGERYLGFRFYTNGKKHYGWARLEVNSPTDWIIKDYAYNAIPDMPILAGQIE